MKLKTNQARFTSIVLLSTMILQSFSPYIPLLEYKKHKSREGRFTHTRHTKLSERYWELLDLAETKGELNKSKEGNKNVAKEYNSVSTLYGANLREGVIGIIDQKKFDNPQDNVFEIQLDQTPQSGQRAYLVYELYGVSDKIGVSKSINDRISRGGYLIKKHYGWTYQKEEINPNWLKKGSNYIQFSVVPEIEYGYKIKNLKLEIENKPTANHPVIWESYSFEGGDTYVRGYFTDGEDRTIHLNNTEIQTTQGEFELVLSGKVKKVSLETGGIRESKESSLIIGKQDYSNSFSSTIKQSQIWFKKDKQKNELELLGAVLEAEGKNLLTDKPILIRGLRSIDLPALDMGMKNVTGKAEGYKFLPHGEHFKEGATIKLSYDRTKLPSGYSEKDIRTYYFDMESGHWVALKRDSVDTKNQVIISRTTHFTDMINGVIQVPESPQTNGFIPTIMSDVQVADPLSKVNLISAPSANNRGTAFLSYTFEMPPARNGMQPNIGIQYNSDGSSGWLGEGWDLPIPGIKVDTRWGVPRYDSTKETETYLLEGEQLVTKGIDGSPYLAHRGEKQPRESDRLFYCRKEGSFATIQRKGDNPGGYFWEITDRKGVKYTYGGNKGIVKGIFTDVSGKSREVISEWKLSRIEELHGDWIEYHYEQAKEAVKGGLTSQSIYLKEVHAGNKGEKAHTIVKFTSNKTKQKQTHSGRTGFLTSQNRLLTHVEVEFEGEKLREYELRYEPGAFYSELLKEVIHLDDKGQKFTNHVFDYYDDVKSNQGYLPFIAEEEVWSKTGEKLNLSKTTSYGGSLYTGVGIFNGDRKFNSGTVGASYNYSTSVTEGESIFIDINGDGLPDKVYRENGVLYYEPNLISPLKGEKFGKPIAIKGINKFSKTKSSSSNGGASARAGIGLASSTVGVSKGSTQTTTTVYFTDVNSDGLIDIVSNGKVYFNHITKDKDGNLLPTFNLESSVTPSPIMGGGSIDSSDTAVDPEEQKDMIYNSPLYDVVKVWEAPFDGKVKIEGQVKLLSPAGDYDVDEYEKADGVRVAIQYKGKERWSKILNKGDFSGYSTNVNLAETIKKGEKIYFRVQSGNQEMSNGSFDQVEWSPVITYIQSSNIEADLNSINPDGQKMYVFASNEANIASQDVVTSVDSFKKAIISGTFEKPITSDQVTVKVIQTDDEQAQEVVVYEKTFEWNQTHTGKLEIKVPEGSQGTNFYFSLSSPTNVNWKKVNWTPHIKLDDSEDPIPATVNYSVYHQKWEGSYYPLEFEKANQTKKISLAFQVLGETPLQNSKLNGDLAITVKKTTGLLGKYKITVENGVVKTAPLTDLEVTCSGSLVENIWVEAITQDQGIIENMKALEFTLKPENGIASSRRYANVFIKDKDKGFGPMYRGWGQFIYNANAGRYSRAIDEKELKLPQDENADMDPRTMIFIPMGLDNDTKSYWSGADRYVYTKDDIMSASRLGEKEVKLTNPLEGLSILPSSSGSCLQGTSGVGVKLLSTSKNTTKQSGASFVVGVNLNDSQGSDETRLSFSDMNGDGYPDIITKNQIQFTNPRGGFEGEIIDFRNGFEGNHRSTSTSKAFGLGANPITAVSIYNKLTGGEKKNSLGAKSSEVAISSVNLSFSRPKMDEQVEHTLVDINGDGLPDRVYKNGKVRLNLGYSFSPEVDWDINEIQTGKSETSSGGADLGVDIVPKSIDKASSSFSGGVNVTTVTNTSNFRLLDVNSDGLIDKVRISDGKAWVSLNKGNSFAPEIQWNQMSRIAKSSSASVSTNASYTLNILIPITFSISLKFSINPGINSSESTSQTGFEIKDVDADGYPDMVWTDKMGGIKVKRSAIGRTNKLSKVSNSIGGKFMLDYIRSEATYDHPGGKWVLSSVEIDDGLHDDGSNMRSEYHYFQGKQDRHEREFLGFGKVETISIDTENNNKPYRKTIQEYDVSNYYNSGHLLKTTLTDAQGNKYAQTENKYYQYEVFQKEKNNYSITSKVLCSDHQASYTPIKYSRHMVFEGKDQGIVTSETKYEYKLSDNYGEISTYYYSDKGNLGENSVGKNYNYRTEIEYASNPSKNIFGLPNQVGVFDNQGNELRRLYAQYDLNYSNHLTLVRQKLNNTDESVSDIQYDKYGNIIQKTLPANKNGQRMWYKYRYDRDYHMYVERIDDAYGYTSLLENYDYRYGVPLTSKDINGYFTETTLDNMGRIQTITGPNELELGLPYTIKYEYSPITVENSKGEIEQPAYAVTRHYNPQHPNQDIRTVSFVDGIGRNVQVKKDGVITQTDPNGSNPKDQQVMIVSGRNTFDPFGRMIKSYYPITEDTDKTVVFNTGFDKIAPTLTKYDLLDRTVGTVLPDSTITTMEYSLNPSQRQQVTTLTDAMGGKQNTYTNGSGLTVKTEQLSGPSGVITTHYGYDAINQLIEVVDTEGQKTHSIYDKGGRRIKLEHPVTGINELGYDALGNVIDRKNAGQHIEYDYDYTRLKSIRYANQGENNVTYYYGNKNSKYNRVGRVSLVEDASGAQEYKYGTLGEITEVRRTVVIPNQAIATYVTQAKYDSWNKIEYIIYPDQEKVDYQYDLSGQLTAVKGSKAYSYDYINKIGYDKFGQRTYLKYCNGSQTTYSYDPLRRRLSDLQVWTSSKAQGGARKQIINNNYAYDAVSNVLSVSNVAPLPENSQNHAGGQIKHEYTYDGLYRLVQAQGTYIGADNKTANYTLDMSYDNLHNIITKKQQVSQQGIMFEGVLQAGYDLKYSYNDYQKNQIKSIEDINYRQEEGQGQEKRKEQKNYQYDERGNLLYVSTDLEKKDLSKSRQTHQRKLRWDQENRLLAINDNGYVSNYVYDATGQRVIKTGGESEQVYINSQYSGGSTQTSDFTAYINPYIVVSPNGRYTKHYYIGSQRIVSKLGDMESFGADPRRIEYAGSSVPGVAIDWKAKYQTGIQRIKDDYKELEVPYHGKDNDDYVNGEGFCCAQNVSAKAGIGTGNVNYEKMQYYYHPDHLGSSTYITNLDSEIVQHVEYLPFGEVFIEERNNSWNTPYLFNGKELDEETGLYYYGARYYNPRESIFLSTDPLSGYNPVMETEHYIDGQHNGGVFNSFNLNTYGYCYQNPVLYVDPNGKQAYFQGMFNQSAIQAAAWNQQHPQKTITSDVLKDAARGVQKDISNIASKLPTAALRMGAKIAQDVGDGASFVGYGLTMTGVGAEVGIPLSNTGNTISSVGSYMEMGADLLEGKFNDAGTIAIKTVAIEVGQGIINKQIDKIPGAGKLTKEILRQNVDVKIKGTEQLYNYMQGKKSETPKDDNKVKIKKD